MEGESDQERGWRRIREFRMESVLDVKRKRWYRGMIGEVEEEVEEEGFDDAEVEEEYSDDEEVEEGYSDDSEIVWEHSDEEVEEEESGWWY